MSTATITGRKDRGGIPRGSTVTIYSHPDNKQIIQFGKVAKTVSTELDPGFYSYTVSGPYQPEYKAIKTYSDTFIHDLTIEQAKKIRGIRPKLAKSMMVTDRGDGQMGSVWRCGIVGCDAEFTAPIAAALHEYEHYGVDPFAAEPDDLSVADEKLAAAKAKQEAPAKIGNPLTSRSLEPTR